MSKHIIFHKKGLAIINKLCLKRLRFSFWNVDTEACWIGFSDVCLNFIIGSEMLHQTTRKVRIGTKHNM